MALYRILAVDGSSIYRQIHELIAMLALLAACELSG